MKILLIYGAGSGLGKTTLAREAGRLLSEMGLTWRLIREEDAPVGLFRRYAARCLEGAGDDTTVLLECAVDFVEDCRRFDGITIVDSILPCWDWLASAGCPPDGIKEFTEQLVEAMAGLASGVVVVDGDVERGLERAISDRGRKWAAELARQRVGSEDLSELASYFGRLRATTGAMLPTWPGSQLRVDTERCRGESARLLGEWLAGALGS